MKSLIALCTVMIAIGSSSSAPAPCDELSNYPVRFAVLGDRTGDHQEGVHEAVVDEIARMRPDFVVTVGDMIEGYISDTIEMNKQWDEYFDIIKSLPMPVHFTPGNHDITFDRMESVYRRRVGEPYHSFDYRGLHIVVLDNSRAESFAEIPDTQIAWLKEDLAKNRDACYTFVFFHKPFWYRTLGDGRPDALHDIFKANGVDAVFTGHFHTYFSGTFDGIQYTSIGSSGGDTEESPDGLLYHFGWVTVDSGGVHVVPIKKGGVLPWNVQTVTEARAASTVKSSAITFAHPLSLTDELILAEMNATILLRNPVIALAWTDTLRWDIPAGWTVTPPVYPYTIAAGETTTAQFAIKAAEKLYPLPVVSTRAPYGEGRTTRVSRELEVARTVHCSKVKNQIVVDGQLNEDCWDKPVTALYNNDGTASVADPTRFYFAYDTENLYFGARCTETQMASLRATMTERDAKVYTEDAVGVMIQLGGPTAEVPQYYVNPLGTVCDQLIERASDGYWSGRQEWDGEVEVKALRGNDYYAVEMRIPLAQVAAATSATRGRVVDVATGLMPQSGDRWRVNFRRKQARTNSTAALQAPWSYDPTSFGVLVFE